MTTDFPTAPLAPGHKGAGGGTVEKSLSASHTEILTLPKSSGIIGQHISFPQRVQVDCPDMAANFTSIDPDESQRVMMEFEGNLRGRDMGSPKAGSISAQLLVLDTKTKECLLKGFPSPAARIPVSVQAQ